MNEHDSLLCGKKLDQLLTRQIEQVSSYTRYLTDIKTAITNNQSSALQELLENQQINPQLIEQTQQQQAEILTEYGYEIDDKGLTRCIQDCTDSQQLQTLKSSLTEQLKELENSLLVNSLLVQKNQQRVKQSIRILSGHVLPDSTAGYSRSGNIENTAETKTILARA